MSDFREAITEAMKPRFASDKNPMKDWITYEGVAGRLLAMPEMQAVRAALSTRALSELNIYGRSMPVSERTPAGVMRRWGLQDSVIAWVLGHD